MPKKTKALESTPTDTLESTAPESTELDPKPTPQENSQDSLESTQAESSQDQATPNTNPTELLKHAKILQASAKEARQTTPPRKRESSAHHNHPQATTKTQNQRQTANTICTNIHQY